METANDFVKIFRKAFFPLSSQYDKAWIKKNSLGENVLYNLESLCEVMDFKEGMRVLDLGCGKAVSAIFLAKEFGVQVWAVDQFITPSENYERIKEMNCESSVFPLRLNAKELPFPKNFFDAVIVVDSYMYFGTDERFTPYISQFLKPGGYIGIVDICFSKEINYLAELPEFMRPHYQDKWYFVHSLEWWVKLWNKTGHLKINAAEIVPQNDFIKHEYIHDFKDSKKNDAIAEALELDKDGLINIFRMAAQRSEKEIYNGNYSISQ
jgi:cyclopropane fatty-acyl-phospholipid synthase-like methyltransferase